MLLRKYMQSYEEELRRHQRNDILIRDIQPYMDEQTMACIRGEELRYCVGGAGDWCAEAKDRSGYTCQEKKIIIDQLCQELGFVSSTYIVEPLLKNGKPANNINAAADPKNGRVLVNENAPIWGYGNLYDIALILVHENYHMNDTTNTGESNREIAAYQAMKDHDFYKYSSDKFKRENSYSEDDYWINYKY